jgi:hypothetical protein
VIFFVEVLKVTEQKELVVKLKELFPQGRITCTEAHDLAREWDMDPRELGEACDKAGIKISACELGCF